MSKKFNLRLLKNFNKKRDLRSRESREWDRARRRFERWRGEGLIVASTCGKVKRNCALWRWWSPCERRKKERKSRDKEYELKEYEVFGERSYWRIVGVVEELTPRFSSIFTCSILWNIRAITGYLYFSKIILSSCYYRQMSRYYQQSPRSILDLKCKELENKSHRESYQKYSMFLKTSFKSSSSRRRETFLSFVASPNCLFPFLRGKSSPRSRSTDR